MTPRSTETAATQHATPQGSADQQQQEFRKLPAVDALLRLPELTLLIAQHGQTQTTAATRQALAVARAQINKGQPAPTADALLAWIDQKLTDAATPTLREVINATGVIVHTNLGRAPLSQAAIAAIGKIASAYSNLEYDLAAGERGSRHDHARRLLCELTGAEDALIVNNNAAAVYFVLTALCQDREVIVSRGELVEIGGGFRIPDVLRQSGARLVEVGTTNRTHPHDFAGAIGPETAALMRIHTSNFKQIGFVTMPTLTELAAVAQRHEQVILIDDLGSGTLLSTGDYGLAAEPMVQESIAAGADIVTFSGDKLLGDHRPA
ncbi:MAG: L-seryl-tRNA(Sec) selenium transferase [Caldilineaceae bacterium]